MGTEKEMALRMALKSVLKTARDLDLDVDQITETAAERFISDQTYTGWYASDAILEIPFSVLVHVPTFHRRLHLPDVVADELLRHTRCSFAGDT